MRQISGKYASRFWWGLPFRRDQKEKIKTFVFSHFPILFRSTTAYRNWKSARFLAAPEPHKAHGGRDEENLFHLKELYQNSEAVMEPADSIAIAIHVFYPDILDELLPEIEKINWLRVRYYITSPVGLSDEIHARFSKLSVDYEHFPVENRGRDILPFLKIMPNIIQDGFQIVLKIHTKKSVQLKTGVLWRNDLFRKLVGESAVKSILNLFNTCPDIGMVGPAGHLVPMNLYYGSNSERLKAVCTAFSIPVPRLFDMSFVAGSMFYARVRSLIPLLNLDLQAGDFEDELGQIDGTMAHAVERAFAISTLASGLKVTDSDYQPEAGKIFITLDHKFTR